MPGATIVPAVQRRLPVGAEVVPGGVHVRVADQDFYEMHIGTFTREGTWAAAARDLPVTYLENHDQVANSARGARLRTLTSPG
jgi:1,4-alpha-glucan branching enzyme